MIDIMSGVNAYGNSLSLSKDEISSQKHRQAVGGLWGDLGRLQFDFMITQGLKPYHKLLDLGCGCLRGGVKFIDFLNEGNYTGIDINESLLLAGRIELEEHNLVEKKPILLKSELFGLDCNIEKIDFAISISLFTHLPISYVQEALFSVKSKLNKNGLYFATFFVCDNVTQNFTSLTHFPGNITTHPHKDPFHINIDLIKFISEQIGLKCTYIGDWNHPRNQKMFKFEHI